LAFDPGAKRMGYACVEGNGVNKPKLYGSGRVGLKREDNEKYQVYKMRLITFWVTRGPGIINSYKPDVIVCEIVPSAGFVDASQSLLADAAITIVKGSAIQAGYEVVQLSANSVKAKIGGKKGATKVGVRNGVWDIMPELKNRTTQWKQSDADESDAFAIALTYLGHDNRQ
jgi:Holliday junction resolvasome RuvABC endonuclease subunit